MPWGDPFADPQPLIRRIYAYVAYRIGDGPDAEDITSSTFERALRYRDRFDARRGDFAGWLIGIARREISDHYAAAKPQPKAAVLEDEAAPDRIEAAAARLDLHRAVRRLDERDRELLALRYGADLTARQIGEVLDMRTNAVEVALHRALQKLRELLGASAGERSAAIARRNLKAFE